MVSCSALRFSSSVSGREAGLPKLHVHDCRAIGANSRLARLNSRDRRRPGPVVTLPALGLGASGPAVRAPDPVGHLGHHLSGLRSAGSKSIGRRRSPHQIAQSPSQVRTGGGGLATSRAGRSRDADALAGCVRLAGRRWCASCWSVCYFGFNARRSGPRSFHRIWPLPLCCLDQLQRFEAVHRASSTFRAGRLKRLEVLSSWCWRVLGDGTAGRRAAEASGSSPIGWMGGNGSGGSDLDNGRLGPLDQFGDGGRPCCGGAFDDAGRPSSRLVQFEVRGVSVFGDLLELGATDRLPHCPCGRVRHPLSMACCLVLDQHRSSGVLVMKVKLRSSKTEILTESTNSRAFSWVAGVVLLAKPP